MTTCLLNRMQKIYSHKEHGYFVNFTYSCNQNGDIRARCFFLFIQDGVYPCNRREDDRLIMRRIKPLFEYDHYLY